jgi:hypothetical protein
MAKSLRSNRIQKNKSKLRSRVFGPVEEARTQRLSQRLAEIAASAAPPPPEKRKARAKDPEAMEADEDPAADDAPSKDDVEPAAEGTSLSLRALLAAQPRERARPCDSDVSLYFVGNSFLAVAGDHVTLDSDDDAVLGALEVESLFALPFDDEWARRMARDHVRAFAVAVAVAPALPSSSPRAS